MPIFFPLSFISPPSLAAALVLGEDAVQTAFRHGGDGEDRIDTGRGPGHERTVHDVKIGMPLDPAAVITDLAHAGPSERVGGHAGGELQDFSAVDLTPVFRQV